VKSSSDGDSSSEGESDFSSSEAESESDLRDDTYQRRSSRHKVATPSRLEDPTSSSRQKEPIDDGDMSGTSSEDSSEGGHKDFCEICCIDGYLVCCDSCDRAYHGECIEVEINDLPDQWQCPSCTGDIDVFKGRHRRQQVARYVSCRDSLMEVDEAVCENLSDEAVCEILIAGVIPMCARVWYHLALR
jgi:hypothetical protein